MSKSYLIERFELDILGRKSIKQKWSFNGVKIMCSYGNKASTPAQIVMKFILKINEAVITGLKYIVQNILVPANLQCWEGQ